MVRARRAALAAFVLAWSLASLALTAAPASGSPPAGGHTTSAVSWPASSGLLIAEVVTGGASASDEYIELTNAGQVSLDLNGLELAYASSAGTSAIRRTGWTTATLLGPGRHLLIANAGGAYAAGADATYTAGMAATGGALVLRPAGGAPIDAVGWGAASNAVIETAVAPAPPAGSSIERGPGGSRGNVLDTNDNAIDWSINPAPVPENLAAPARPTPGSSPSPSASPRLSPSPKPSPSTASSPGPSHAPSPTPTPSTPPSSIPSPKPSPSPSPSLSPSPTPAASPKPSPSPTPVPSPTASPSPGPSARTTPTPGPSRTPTPIASASPVPTTTPSPPPTPSPSSSNLSIAQAIRSGGTVTVDGVVTTDLTLIDASGRLLLIQDSTAAIEVRLPVGGDGTVADLAGRPLSPGAHLQVTGVIGRAYGAPRLSATAVMWLGSVSQSQPIRITAAPGPGLEWRLVHVTGRLDSVHRLGLRWRADLIVGSVRIPVMGLTGAHIAVGRLLAGRRVTIVGIVRRAYPSAIDQRFAIDPRSASDMAFEPADPARPTATGRSTQTGGSRGSTGGSGRAAGPPPPSGGPTVDLRDLGSHRGQLVRVGGLVTAVDGSLVSIDDGTAPGRLKLIGDAAAYLDLVETGDPVGAIGRVASDAVGPYLLVTDPNGVTRAGATSAGTPTSGAASLPAGNPEGATSGSPAGAAKPIQPGLTDSGPSGAGQLSLLEGLALALLGAVAGLAIALSIARRGVGTAPPAGPEEGPRARPTLGSS